MRFQIIQKRIKYLVVLQLFTAKLLRLHQLLYVKNVSALLQYFKLHCSEVRQILFIGLGELILLNFSVE